MVIICEGMDNSGKSTLARTLQKDLNAALMVAPRPRNREMPRHWLLCVNQVERHVDHVVLDRVNQISEIVYGNTLRDHSWCSPEDIVLLAGMILVYCRPPDEVILKFDQSIPQMEGVIDNARSLLSFYDELMLTIKNAGCTIYKYDWTVENSYLHLLSYLRSI